MPSPADLLAEFAPVCDWVEAHCRAGGGEAARAEVETAATLRELGAEAGAQAAALLLPLAPLNEKEEAGAAARFGADLPALLRGAARMRQLSALSLHARAADAVNEENLRKMLIAMVDDARVVLIELARHLSQLRRCKRADAAAQKQIARVTLDVYAPLANRIGARRLKWQMEDFALRFLEPEAYHGLANALRETRLAREDFIAHFISALEDALRAAGIDAEVHGRPKHLYGIWKKMRSKDMPLERLFDLRAVRILADGVADCYAALAVVHTRWNHLAREFDDYIATPKANGYRSIHTVVTANGGKNVEVQIRTRDMHRENELGAAAHWRYKENVRADDNIDRKILRLRQLLEWQAELRDAGALSPAAESQRRIYVFTPKGTVIDLPEGATPIDFAYAVHTEVGHAIRGARVNGKMSPLGRKLQTGEQVHVQTAKGGRPSRDWLRAELKLVRTQRARNRIARWFKHADYAQHVADGRALLERELTRLGKKELAYEKIARAAGFEKNDDFLAALGGGDLTAAKALSPFRDESETPPPQKTRRKRARGKRGAFRVSGVGNLLTRMAHCCRPIPGDDITGYITSGQGVSIHRRDCANIVALDEPRRARLVEVQWSDADSAAYPVEIRVQAYARGGLVNDITQLLKEDKVLLRALEQHADAGDEQLAWVHLQLEISGVQRLGQIMRRLQRVANVREVRRVG